MSTRAQQRASPSHRSVQHLDAGDESVNSVRVVLRIRPLLPSETERGESSNAHAMPDNRTVMVTAQLSQNRKVESQQHKLDQVFSGSTSQIEFFSMSGVESYCESALEGMASTIFCFGQTGSGKTYTMSGPILEQNELDDHAGIQFRAAHYMMRCAEDINSQYGETRSGFKPVILKASYIEIYNEAINDLLNETTNLKSRWSQAAQSFFIENLMIVQCDDIDDMLAVLTEGNGNRKRSSHKLNVDSSRSHVLFTIYVERRDAPNAPPKLGKIHFVDLAGSEKLKDSESSGIHEEETKSINKSLFALGNVISCLAKAGKGESFIPYRDSTLTKLLMDSLGGNAKTLMVACITPSNRFTEESLRTITYAMRTKNIVNANPSVRLDPKQQQLYELKVELEMMRKENALLKTQLAAAYGGAPPTSTNMMLRDARASPSLSRTNSMLDHPSLANSTAASVLLPNLGSFGLSPYALAPPGTAQSSASAPPNLFPAAVGTLFTSSPTLGAVSPASSGAAGGAWTTSTTRSLPTLSLAPQPTAPLLTTQQHAALEIANKVQRDNDELRREVALLRTMVLNMKTQKAGGSSVGESDRETIGSSNGFGSSLPLGAISSPSTQSTAGRVGGDVPPSFERKAFSSPSPPMQPQPASSSGVFQPRSSNPAAAPPPVEAVSSGDDVIAQQQPSLTDFGFRPAPKRVQKLIFPSS